MYIQEPGFALCVYTWKTTNKSIDFFKKIMPDVPIEVNCYQIRVGYVKRKDESHYADKRGQLIPW